MEKKEAEKAERAAQKAAEKKGVAALMKSAVAANKLQSADDNGSGGMMAVMKAAVANAKLEAALENAKSDGDAPPAAA